MNLNFGRMTPTVDHFAYDGKTSKVRPVRRMYPRRERLAAGYRSYSPRTNTSYRMGPRTTGGEGSERCGLQEGPTWFGAIIWSIA